MVKKSLRAILLKILPEELVAHIKFEFYSKLGRLFARDLIIDLKRKNYINLGCGDMYIDGIINIDFFTNKKIDYGLDLRYPFRISDRSIDGIFSDHTFEHLNHAEVDQVLSESFRVLKSGATIRIIVPDMSIFIYKYCQNDESWFDEWKRLVLIGIERERMHGYFTKIFALNFTSNFYHHKSCWDFEMAQFFLKKNGFKNVKKCSFRQGTQGLLYDKDHEDRKFISLYVEATKD